MIPQTSKRALLLLVSDIKNNVKLLNVSPNDMDIIYSKLHDLLGELVVINHESHSKKLGGGGKHGRTL